MYNAMRNKLLLLIIFVSGTIFSSCENEYGCRGDEVGYVSNLAMLFIDEDGKNMLNAIVEKDQIVLNPDSFRLYKINGATKHRVQQVPCAHNGDQQYMVYVMFNNFDEPILSQTLEVQCPAIFGDDNPHRIEVGYSRADKSKWDYFCSHFTFDDKECLIEETRAIIVVDSGK